MAELTVEQARAKLERLDKVREEQSRDAVDLRAFFRGEQPLKYATKEWSTEHQARYKDFADNWCEVVANSNAERINFTGFRLPTGNAKADPKKGMSRDERRLWDEWRKAEMEARAQQGTLETIVSRRSYVYVWRQDDDSLLIDWKQADSCAVQYDPITGRDRIFGILVWDDEDERKQHAQLYTKTEVFAFWRSKGVEGLVLPAGVASEIGGWIYDEGMSGPNHLGLVPIVEFQNRPQLGHGPLSDIAGVRAMQEAINLLWAYLFTAADHASMPARVVMGQQPPKIPLLDENGVRVGEQTVDIGDLARGRLLWLTGQQASIGQWDAAALDVFTAVIEQAVGHIAAQTRTPPHYLVANKGLSSLSGDALKAAEAGLISKVKQTIAYLNSPKREVFRLIALQLGNKKLAEACRLGIPLWGDVENRSEAQAADAMLKRQQAGWPFAYLLEEMDKSPEEIDRILAMKQAEAEMNAKAMLGDLMNGQIAINPSTGEPIMPPTQNDPSAAADGADKKPASKPSARQTQPKKPPAKE